MWCEREGGRMGKGREDEGGSRWLCWGERPFLVGGSAWVGTPFC
jgi:hypothetical protein